LNLLKFWKSIGIEHNAFVIYYILVVVNFIPYECNFRARVLYNKELCEVCGRMEGGWGGGEGGLAANLPPVYNYFIYYTVHWPGERI
jgi:hypothetical protein